MSVIRGCQPLALGGLYVIVAFTVARRRREIGIRSALGARPHRLLGSVLGRVAVQLALGIVAGLVVASVLDRLVGGEFLTGRNGLLLTGVAGVMVLAGMLAGWGPAREGLRVQPSEALRGE
jgi:ABC-type antimicrobial peptide transport system permease subunit